MFQDAVELVEAVVTDHELARAFICMCLSRKTDGGEYRGGILYEVNFERPGHFAQALNVSTMSLATVNSQRTTSPHSDCD